MESETKREIFFDEETIEILKSEGLADPSGEVEKANRAINLCEDGNKDAAFALLDKITDKGLKESAANIINMWLHDRCIK